MSDRCICVIGASGRVGRMMRLCYDNFGIGPGPGADGTAPRVLWVTRDNPEAEPATSDTLTWSGEVSAPAIEALLDAAGPLEGILLLSGQTPGPGVTLEDYRQLNIELPRLLREAAARRGIGQLCLTSTAAVFGAVPEDVSLLTEDAPCAPVSDYGQTKRAMELEALSAPEDRLRLTVARIANIAGADQIVQNALKATAEEPMQIHRFVETGAGPLRSYLGPIDLARGLFALMRPESEKRELIHVTRSPAVQAEALADAIRAQGLGGGNWVYTPAPVGTISRVVMDGGRIATLAGLVPVPDTATEIIHQIGRLLSLESLRTPC